VPQSATAARKSKGIVRFRSDAAATRTALVGSTSPFHLGRAEFFSITSIRIFFVSFSLLLLGAHG
jgi:hypothetical protein